MLADFRRANYNAPEIEIVREALTDHIEQRLREPEMKARFEAARAERLNETGKIARLKPVPDA